MTAVFKWTWPAILITIVAACGYAFSWPIGIFASALGILLVTSLIWAHINVRDNEAIAFSRRIKDLTGYFHRRFMSNSPLSIFSLATALFETRDQRLWEWARACSMSEHIFDTWCESFLVRMEVDSRTNHLVVYLRHNTSELWTMVCRYHELVEQFRDIGEKANIPADAITAYNTFVVEYNTFIRELQAFLSELRNKGYSEIEPPSLRLAHELTKK